MNQPRISVLMPAWNAEKFIAQAIESVLAQTYADFELLIIEDASTDKTKAVVQAYLAKDKRVKLLEHSENKGVAEALNTGLKNAQGAYIARADADDLNRNDRFEKQITYLEKHPEAMLLGGGYAPFNENGHRLDIFHPTSSVEIAWRFVSNSFFCHPSVMFRRQVFEKLGGYPLVEAEDFAYFSKVVRKFKCANLPVILLDYRESLTNRSFSVAEKIEKSVQAQSRENFLYYLGSEEAFELFYAYQHQRKLRWQDLPKIMSLNQKIIGKIGATYQLNFWSLEILKLQWKIMIDYVAKLFFS